MDAGVWDRYDVSHWQVQRVEQRGSSRILWLIDPATENAWLHKDTGIPENGLEQGEDWAEVVGTQVARLLGVPCATTRLCWRTGRRGSLSLNLVPDGHSLWEGNVVMERASSPGYFPHVEGRRAVDPARPTVKRPGHNLANIRAALEGVTVPPNFAGPETLTAFDVFAGYILLDALIANRDRHEQNWAVLTPPLVTSPERLAPSYDHAGGLGYNLRDVARRELIGDRTRLAQWAERGTAHRFEHDGKPKSLVAHGADAIALASSQGADWWLQRVADLDVGPVLDALLNRAIPEMSAPAATLAVQLLELNLRRLRDALS